MFWVQIGAAAFQLAAIMFFLTRDWHMQAVTLSVLVMWCAFWAGHALVSAYKLRKL